MTLEPCAHIGKTGPCVDELIKAGVSRVVCPLIDPDPRVSGKGFKKLKSAKISLDLIPIAKPLAEEVTAGFISRNLRKRPFVTAKLGISFDGKIASQHGTSKWITNDLAREHSKLLRVQNDAVLVGTKTFAADNPSLNTRGAFKLFKTPLRLFLDRKLSVIPSDSILENVRKYPSILVCGKKPNKKILNIWRKHKIQIIEIPEIRNKLDMKYLLKLLANKGINSLLVEGGGEIIATFISNSLIDRLVEYRSGVILGSNATDSIGKLQESPKEICKYPNLNIKSIRQLGDNIEIIWETNKNVTVS